MLESKVAPPHSHVHTTSGPNATCKDWLCGCGFRLILKNDDVIPIRSAAISCSLWWYYMYE